MGRNPIKENQNPYFRARKQAAEWDARLESRERASELIGIAAYTLADYELGNVKRVPADKVLIMAEKYNIAQKRQGKSRIPGIGRDSLVQIWYRTRKNIPEITLSPAIFPMASIRTESRNFLRPSQMTVFPLFMA